MNQQNLKEQAEKLHELAGKSKEIVDIVAFHPRAWRLMVARKNFVVVAEDEPYFTWVYEMIAYNERGKGTWSEEDERLYQEAMRRVKERYG
jgi:hypothetical protein